MRVGLAAGWFLPGEISTDAIVTAASPGVLTGAATILSVLFSLNLLLGCFNLLPIPPLDGFGVLGLFTDSNGALSLLRLRMKVSGVWMLVGILIASRLLGYGYDPLLRNGVRAVYAFYRFH